MNEIEHKGRLYDVETLSKLPISRIKQFKKDDVITVLQEVKLQNSILKRKIKDLTREAKTGKIGRIKKMLKIE